MKKRFILQPFCNICLLLGLVVVLAACASAGGSGTGSADTSATPQTQGTVPTGSGTATPSASGPQACPDSVKDPTRWDPIIPTQTSVSSVNSVTCGYLKGMPTLQALVTVLYQSAGRMLDVYVFDNITAAKPAQLFRLQSLYRGDARISAYNTLLTVEVDQGSSLNNNKSGAALVPDLFREFKWSDSAGTLVQISFPGIFPDLTRYQAESDQIQVNQGYQPWKLSATMTARAFGTSLLHWDPDAQATLASGGGIHDAKAVVSLKNTSPGSSAVMLTMARLEGNINGGIWIITAVTSSGLSITQPRSADLLQSSVTIAGTGSAFEGVIGKVTILDHLYADIGHAQARGATGNGATTFSAAVICQPTFKTGAQEGLVLLTSENNASGGIAGAVIVKVLIQR